MKKTLQIMLAVWVVLSFCFYAGGSFMNTTFNIAHWKQINREVIGGIWIGLSGLMLLVILSFVLSMYEPDKKH